MYINQLNSPIGDVFFKYITEFGSFLTIGPILAVLLFIRYRFALIASISSLLSLIFVQIGKRLVWVDSPRPSVFLNEISEAHFVKGVHLHTTHSFPSGHTAGAFALFFALVLFVKNPIWKLLFLLMAFLVGYSRMYLSQHFLIDVTVGGLLGILSAVLAFVWMNNTTWSKKTCLNASLSDLFKRS